MNKDYSKWIIVGIAWLVQLLGFAFYIGTQMNELERIKADLEKANILVMQNEIKHLNSTATEIKKQVDVISNFIMTLGN